MDCPNVLLQGTSCPSRQDAVRSRARGFTLTELIIVVGVLGLLVAFGVPSTSRFIRSARVNGAANMLAADIHYARSLATAQRRTYKVAFRSNNYVIAESTPWVIVKTRQMPRGVTLAATDTVRFFAWGLTSPTTVTVTGHDGAKTLSVAANGSVN